MPTDIALAATSAMIIRTATVRLQCCCAKPFLGYRVELPTGDTVTDTSPEPLATRQQAMEWALATTTRGHVAIRVVPAPNDDYRRDCLSVILPGDRYLENTRGACDEDHYCLRCGIERAASIERL